MHRFILFGVVFAFSVAFTGTAWARQLAVVQTSAEPAADGASSASSGSSAAHPAGAWARRPKTTAEKIRADPNLYDRWKSTQLSMALGFTFLAAGVITAYSGLSLVDAEDKSIHRRGAKTMAIGITGIAGGLGFFIYTAMERDRIRRAVASDLWSIYRGRRIVLSMPTLQVGLDKTCHLGFGGRF